MSYARLGLGGTGLGLSGRIASNHLHGGWNIKGEIFVNDSTEDLVDMVDMTHPSSDEKRVM